MKQYRIWAACAAACVALALQAHSPKYVFVFIGDGMSTPQRMTAEEFSRATGRGPLAMNALPFQCQTRTRSANSLITDSAAAATAIACGEKANNGALGVAPDGRRLESVAEIAHARGMKVGIMTTVTIVHATPGGFYAHRKSRGDTYGIGLDLVDSGFEFFAGGGLYGKEDDRKHPQYRGNLFAQARERGYAFVTNRAEFAALRPGTKAWGVFAKEALDFSIDAQRRPSAARTQPTLAEIVTKAVELLYGPQGFFIMAEGGKVDYAAHANDAGTTVRDLLAFDDAVRVACAFADRHPDETLIVTTGDHETGGLAMGFAGTGYKYDVQLLARQTCSSGEFSARVKELLEAKPALTFKEIQGEVTQAFGLLFDPADAKTDEDKLLVLKPAEIALLEKAFAADVEFLAAHRQETTKHDVARRRQFAAACHRLLDSHAGVGWSSGHHTAMPTLTTARGCGAETFRGYLENADIAHKLRELIARD